MVPEEGFELADRSGCGRSRGSPASGHPLMAVSHGARRAPVTRMTIRSEDFKSFIYDIYDIYPQYLTTRYNT